MLRNADLSVIGVLGHVLFKLTTSGSGIIL